MDNKQRLDWFSLERYTKEFKEWILKLFRKVHARLGHIEEDLIEIKYKSNNKYYIKETKSSDKVTYTLYDSNGIVSGSDSIIIKPDGGIIVTKWEEEIYD